jgi:hypothetical protein
MALPDQTSLDPPDARTQSRLPAVTGDYCCLVCGRRILGSGELPACPTCHQRAWRLVAWRPFTAPDATNARSAGGGAGS